MKTAFHSFRYSVAILLIITASAKLVSSGSGAKILELPDPVFQIPFQYMLWCGSLMELGVALICLANKQIWIQATAIALLATNFLIYRTGLWLLGYKQPCSCMGRLTDGLHLSPENADLIMKAILAYLLLGSYAALIRIQVANRKGNAKNAMA